MHSIYSTRQTIQMLTYALALNELLIKRLVYTFLLLEHSLTPFYCTASNADTLLAEFLLQLYIGFVVHLLPTEIRIFTFALTLNKTWHSPQTRH